MERKVGGGVGMGNTCKPMAVSFQCMTKSTTIKKKIIIIRKKERKYRVVMVFTDRDLETGVDEKRNAGDPSLE